MNLAVELDRKQKRQLVDRVANSATFLRSPRLRDFLLYVADCTLNDRPEDAREQQIAQNVFNRRPDYNAGQDNIVRVEARSLRKRLEAYFLSEGKDEPFVLVIPRGSYAVSFEARTAEANGTPEEAVAIAPVPVEPAKRPVKRWVSYLQDPRTLLAVIVLLLAALAILLYLRGASGPAPSQAAHVLPLSEFIDSPLETYIVTSDTCLVAIQDLSRQRITLKDYINRRYPAEAPLSSGTLEAVQFLLDRNYTDAHEVAVAGRILQLTGRLPQHMSLRSARKVQLSDLQNHNVILLGGTISNPWAKLYFDKLNFESNVKDVPTGQRVFFRNRAPRPGEQTEYFSPTLSGQAGEAYAVVAFMPNVSGSGSALVLAGTTAEATAAAGDFVLDSHRVSNALKAIRIDPAGTPRYFELMLKAMTFPGGATQASVVAWRVIPEPK